MIKETHHYREVKKDKKGQYFHYGGYKVRPTKATKAVEGKVVRMMRKDYIKNCCFEVLIGKAKEHWKARFQLEDKPCSFDLYELMDRYRYITFDHTGVINVGTFIDCLPY